jgi:hypothetical protein
MDASSRIAHLLGELVQELVAAAPEDADVVFGESLLQVTPRALKTEQATFVGLDLLGQSLAVSMGVAGKGGKRIPIEARLGRVEADVGVAVGAAKRTKDE